MLFHHAYYKSHHVLKWVIWLIFIVVLIFVTFTLIGAYHNGQWPFYRNDVTKHVTRTKVKPHTKIKTKTRVRVKRVPRVTKYKFHSNKHKNLENLLNVNQAQLTAKDFWHDFADILMVRHVTQADDDARKEFLHGSKNNSYKHLSKYITHTEDLQDVYDGQTGSIKSGDFQATRNGDDAVIYNKVAYHFDWDIGTNENGDNAYRHENHIGKYKTIISLKNGKIIRIARID